jgi:zinc transport system permease protein
MTIFEMFTSPFFQTALIAGILASFASGVIGSYVVVKRIVFLSGSIAHSVLSGMGIFLYLQRKYNLTFLNPLYGAILAAIVSAFIIGWIHLNYSERKDAIIASIWSTGMAIGVIFISLTPGYNVELFDFLFGNILWVTNTDLLILCGLDILLAIIVSLNFQKFLAVCVDEEQAKLQGIAVNRLYLLLLCLVAVTVVLLIQVIGVILVIALLALPPLIAINFTNRLWKMMLIAFVFCSLFNFIGLIISYQFNLPSGATIALVAIFTYLSILIFKDRIHRKISTFPIK